VPLDVQSRTSAKLAPQWRHGSGPELQLHMHNTSVRHPHGVANNGAGMGRHRPPVCWVLRAPQSDPVKVHPLWSVISERVL